MGGPLREHGFLRECIWYNITHKSSLILTITALYLYPTESNHKHNYLVLIVHRCLVDTKITSSQLNVPLFRGFWYLHLCIKEIFVEIAMYIQGL